MITPLQYVRRILGRVLKDQLEDLLINQRIFHQFATATGKHVGAGLGADLAEWIAQCYVAFASTAIRRMVEPPRAPPKPRVCPQCGHTSTAAQPKSEASVSLVIFLEELKKHPALLTRTQFRKLFNPLIREQFADKWFDKIAGKKGASAVPIAAINRDIAKVKRSGKPVKRLVNKLVGHTEWDRREIGKHRFGEMNAAISVLFRVFKKYAMLINGKEPALSTEDYDVTQDLAKIWP